MSAGHNQYAPMPGLPALREGIAGKVRDLYAAGVDMDTEITVTSGATEALFVATGVQPNSEGIGLETGGSKRTTTGPSASTSTSGPRTRTCTPPAT